MPIEYSNGKIYKLVDLETDMCYIGSTCEKTLARRLATHINYYKNYKKQKCGFVTSFYILEKNNYSIQLIENYPCSTKDELTAREGFYISSLNCVNKRVEGRTRKETTKSYYEKNKQKINEKNKQRYEINKEYRHIQKNTNNDCECGGHFTNANKASHLKSKKHLKFITH